MAFATSSVSSWTAWSDPARIYAGPVAFNIRGVYDVFPSGDALPEQTEAMPNRPSRPLPDLVPVPAHGTLYPVVLDIPD